MNRKSKPAPAISRIPRQHSTVDDDICYIVNKSYLRSASSYAMLIGFLGGILFAGGAILAVVLS